MQRLIMIQKLILAADVDGRVTFAPSGLVSGQKFRVKAVTIIPNATSAANDTNYATLQLVNGSTNAATARSTTVAGGALTANTPFDLTLTAGQSDFSQASPLSLQVTHPGTGVAVDISVAVEYEILRPAA